MPRPILKINLVNIDKKIIRFCKIIIKKFYSFLSKEKKSLILGDEDQLIGIY